MILHPASSKQRHFAFIVLALVLLSAPAQHVAEEHEFDEATAQSEIALIEAELRRRHMASRFGGQKGTTGLDEEGSESLVSRLHALEKSIYCPEDDLTDASCDSRMEIRDAAPELKAMARSAVMIVDTKKDRNVIKKRGGFWRLKSTTLKSGYNVCSDEPFADQPAPGRCSGFLIGADLVATAGHCISTRNLDDKVFVFDFAIDTDGSGGAPLKFRDDQVYKAKELVGRMLNQQRREDWAIVRLDRATTGRPAVTLAASKTANDASFCVIGHPVGLPMKVACGAEIRQNTHSQFFTAPLDTFGGNSGSMVINEANREVEGILVRGEVDFVYRNFCLVSKKCPANGCAGEDVTRSSVIAAYIKQIED